MPLNGLPERDLAPGELVVTEYGHRLGHPDGALVLRCTGPAPITFPAVRDDWRHQIFWAPGGSLALRRGSEVTWTTAGEIGWVRRGGVVEVVSTERQEVVVALVRRAPDHLEEFPAGVCSITEEAGAALLALGADDVGEHHGDALLAATLAGIGELRPLAFVDAGQDPVAHVVAALTADPSLGHELTEWAARLHVSPRTLARGFRRTFGLTWTQWRTQHRLHAARVLLESHSVTQVAHQVGYTSTSAFVQAFRREFDTTPGDLRSA